MICISKHKAQFGPHNLIIIIVNSILAKLKMAGNNEQVYEKYIASVNLVNHTTCIFNTFMTLELQATIKIYIE